MNLTQLLVSILEVIHHWLDPGGIDNTPIPDSLISISRQILLPNTTGKAFQAQHGSSRKAEIELLQELIDLITPHLDAEQFLLSAIPANLNAEYRRKVVKAIDERWLMIATLEIRIATLSTAIQYDRSCLRSAAIYYQRQSPHSRQALELRKQVLNCYLKHPKSRLSGIYRLLHTKAFIPLLYLPHRLVMAIRERNQHRLWSYERRKLNDRSHNHDNQYRHIANLINGRTQYSEFNYLINNTPNTLFTESSNLIRQALKKVGRQLPAWSMYGTSKETHRRILVTRGYGGIGDLTMMSSGLCSLAQHGDEVIFGIPKPFHDYTMEYFAPCAKIQEVPRLSEIHQYDQIFDFSICPTWGKEVTRLLHTAIPRHIIFSRAMKVPTREILEGKAISFRENPNRGSGRKPKISIQISSDEAYRNIPSVEKLVHRLASIPGLEVVALCTSHNKNLPANVIQTAGMALVDSVRTIENSQLLICPDSAFLHIGEGLGIKTFCLAGPTVSSTLASYYSHARVIRNPAFSACSPCYRSQNTACKLLECVELHSPCLEGDWFHEQIITIIKDELNLRAHSEGSQPGA